MVTGLTRRAGAFWGFSRGCRGRVVVRFGGRLVMSAAMEENQHQAHHSEHYKEVHRRSFREELMLVGCPIVVMAL